MLNEKTAKRRMTKQRQAIMDMLAASYEHPTAEMIYAEVRRELPDISLGTVYRNLQLLVADGLAQEINLGRGGSRFDGNLQPHSHFFCQRCGQVYDVPMCRPQLPPDWQKQLPGKLLGQRTDFFGVCSDCLAQKAQNE